MTEWYEREVTAKDLLEMQQAAADAEEKANRAWHAINAAKQAVLDAERKHSDARYNAECAAEELRMMEEAIRGGVE